MADCVIDTERLGGDEKYRESIGLQLADSLGPNAFADYRASACPDDSVTHAPAMRHILSADKRLRSLVKAIPSHSFDALGDASRRLLGAVI